MKSLGVADEKSPRREHSDFAGFRSAKARIERGENSAKPGDGEEKGQHFESGVDPTDHAIAMADLRVGAQGGGDPVLVTREFGVARCRWRTSRRCSSRHNEVN